MTNPDNKGGRPRHILLVEDNPGDIRLLAEVFKHLGLPHPLHVAEYGQQAMSFLRRQEPYADAPCPDLILLDLNLPNGDGREVLKEIKADPKLKVIPVVILTSSEAEHEIIRAYREGANSYIVKPPTVSELIEIVRAIDRYWLAVARLPPPMTYDHPASSFSPPPRPTSL